MIEGILGAFLAAVSPHLQVDKRLVRSLDRGGAPVSALVSEVGATLEELAAELPAALHAGLLDHGAGFGNAVLGNLY